MPVRNRIGDLADYLFEELERLNEHEGDGLEAETARAKAMCTVADKIIGVADVQVRAAELVTAVNGVPKVGRLLQEQAD